MLSDPLLQRYGVVMLDEVHERSVEIDIVVALMKKILQKRPELRLIVASATLDTEQWKNFFTLTSSEDGPHTDTFTSSTSLQKNPTPSVHDTVHSSSTDSSNLTHNSSSSSSSSSSLLLSSSSSLSHTPSSSFYSSGTSVILHIDGNLHAVGVQYLQKPTDNYLLTAADLCREIYEYGEEGDVLVFLPGVEEIDAVKEMLEEKLHGERYGR